jgi:hypothetical protein
MTLIGRHIKQTWINGDFRQTWVRRIDRETVTQYVSEVQRTVKDYKADEIKYVFYPKWAQRFRKRSGADKTPAPIVTKLHNSNGHYELQLVKDYNKDLRCIYSYAELFQTDLRELQQGENSWPLASINRRNKDAKEDGTRMRSYLLEEYIDLVNPERHWNAPLMQYLQKTFNVPIYEIMGFERVNEAQHKNKLTYSKTFWHINIFNNDKPEITMNENESNRTIAFWLFEDRLVFQTEDGIDTW